MNWILEKGFNIYRYPGLIGQGFLFAENLEGLSGDLGHLVLKNWVIKVAQSLANFGLRKTRFMQDSFNIPQLLLRFALGITFLTPVADRLGILGAPGTGNIEWGNWNNFIDYTATLMPIFERPMVNVMGSVATAAELLVGIFLIIGFKTKYAAIGASLITLTFILFMTLSVGIQKPINYGVFTASAAGFMLSFIPNYKWSIDHLLNNKAK